MILHYVCYTNVVFMKFKIVVLCFVAQFVCLCASAQDFQIKHFDINNGLSNNSVFSVFQDKEGFIWCGTYDGLNKFDGYNFKIYRNTIGDSTSLVSNSVYTIAESKHGGLWTGGARGACRLNKTTDSFERLFYNPYSRVSQRHPLTSEVHQIKCLATGMLVATKEQGLLYFKDNTITGAQVPLLLGGKKIYNYDAVTAEYIPQQKVCWVAIRNYGICRLDLATMNLLLVHRFDQKVYCLLHDTSIKNSLWLGTGSGAYILNTDTGLLSQNKMEGRHTVLHILKDKSGTVWMATDGHGIFTSRNSAQAIPYVQPGKKLISQSNSFICVYQDRQDNIWFGTLRAGISLLGHDPQRFSHVLINKDAANTAPHNFVLSFCEGSRNDIWIGTDGAGLKRWDRTAGTFTQYTAGSGGNELSSNFITGLARGNGDDLWISTWYGGVNRLNTKTGAITRFECYNPYTGQAEKNTWLVFRDVNNTIWVSATNEGTLYYFDDKAQAFAVFNKDIRNLQCLTQTKDGHLWGGNYSTLYNIDVLNKSFTTYDLGYPVRSVKQDHSGSLWVGTQEGGLLLFNTSTGTYRRFTTKDGLPGNSILRILEDKRGDLWLSTYNGLSRFDKKNIFRNFSASDGLQSNQFSFNAGLKLSSGELLFGGINGFNVFYPESVVIAKESKDVRLNGIWLNSKPLNGNSAYLKGTGSTNSKNVELPYDQTALSFDFVLLDYLHPDKVRYAYMLDGWDDHWIYTDNQRKANYNHLREGSYTFKVKTLNGDGTWNKPVTLAGVTVLPPWYRTWWSYVLYILSGLGLIVAWVRYNRYKIEMAHRVELAHIERKQEKEMAQRQMEMFTYITHEFRTPLSLIINPLRHATQKLNVTDEGVTKELGVAHRNARRLLSLVDQLLLFRKAESDADELVVTAIDVKHLCREVYECFVNLARQQQIDFVLEMPDGTVEIFGDYEKIEIALFNIASNAFKYTAPKGQISIKVADAQDSVAISISDNGAGIAAQDLPHIFNKFNRSGSKIGGKSGFGVGLFITKYFVEKHHASINATSVKGEGSVFELKFLKGYDVFANMAINPARPKMSELVEELVGKDTVEDMLQTPPAVVKADKELLTEKKSILIVEDNTEMREYLQSLFAANRIVYVAQNGIIGYELAQKHHPDIIISDISMEGMDGLELCQKIKNDKELGHLPVILLTATSSQEVQLKGISEGADDFITKPFNSDILIAKVDRLLESRGNLKKYFLDSITLKDNGTKFPAEYADFLKKCIEIIEANFGNPDFNLKFFALEMGMSHRSLYDKIKQISGQTLNAFIRSVRLRRAALLMLTENKNIGQISSQVGFEDQRYFREQFVKLFGMTPSEYIRRYKNNFNRELNVIKDE